MGEVRLNGLEHMRIHLQYSQPVDVEAVVNHFATSGRARRLNFYMSDCFTDCVSLKHSCAFIISVVLP